jgi:ABC-type transport system involved in multi-copper enzyme maturation permease subunit
VNGTLAVARYTLLELSRRRILLVFFVVGAVGIVLLGIFLKIATSLATQGTAQSANGATQLDPAQMNQLLEAVFVSYLLGALGIFALLIAFAIGMTTIYHDLESGTAVSLFSKPISRLAYTIGKISAAVAALVLVVGVLGIEARLAMLLFGGGLEGALTAEVFAVVANTVVVMLIVLALSTWMNNIIAAVVAFIYYDVVAALVVTIRNLAHQGVIDNGLLKGVFDVLYWVVPHELTSSASGEIARTEIQVSGGGSANAATLAAIPPASGAGDILWWAFVVIVFASLVYVAVRRRQV